MSGDDATPMLIWTGGDCAGPPGYGYGGWAWLSLRGGAARGFAGGERHTTAAAMALRAMIEALNAAAGEPATSIQLDPGDAGVARIGADLVGREAAGWRTAEGDPIEHPELWKEVAAAVRATHAPVRFVAAGPPASDARVFVDAWIDFARDKCKAKGAFTAAIPRPNLQTLMTKRARP
jgi:ribonuclease HI